MNMNHGSDTYKTGQNVQMAIDKCMEAFTTFGESIPKLADGIAELMTALIENMSKNMVFGEIINTYNTYQIAAANHPEWVHRANYSKKRRVRKKYHDRIIRQYSSAMKKGGHDLWK